MTPSFAPLHLKVGGAVDARRDVYIVRPADDELFGLLERGEYCNVLGPHQTGKTSLLAQVFRRLNEHDVSTARVDIAGDVGTTHQDADDWYRDLLDAVARKLKLKVDVPAWWQAQGSTALVQRLNRFFLDHVAAKERHTVVAFDEIGVARQLPFRDDLFTALRSMYNDRDQQPAYSRIAFCLAGVAQTGELIEKPQNPPYNVARTIELPCFDADRHDLRALYEAMASNARRGKALVREVLAHTQGHPFRTMKLCDAVLRNKVTDLKDVAGCVQEALSSCEPVAPTQLAATGLSADHLERILSRFQRVVLQLQSKKPRARRSRFAVRDEYDVQKLLYALLHIYFDDIRPEEGTPSHAGGNSRMDFLLKTEQVVIEVKMTRDGLGNKEVGDQLTVDTRRYQAHPDCKALVCFVYDPSFKISNPRGLERDLSSSERDFTVKVIVTPKP